MPIILSEQLAQNENFTAELEGNHAAWISQATAEQQDIRAARIGILNLMPRIAMDATQIQWLRYISHTDLQIEPVFVKFDDDPREGQDEQGRARSRSDILAKYTPFSDVKATGLDGLIVTGDNLERKDDSDPPEAMPLHEVRYLAQLNEVFTWAEQHVFSSIFSCFGAHLKLNHLTGQDMRVIQPTKTLGIYEHEIDRDSGSVFLQNMDDIMPVPHARWGDVSVQALGGTAVEVLAKHPKVGWLLAEHSNQAGGTDLFIQGHPEYDRYDLHNEYIRDREQGQRPPHGYYRHNDPSQPVVMRWGNAARALHSNWISLIYQGVIANSSQSAPEQD